MRSDVADIPHEYTPPVMSDNSIGLWLIVAGCFPFVVGALMAAADGTDRIPVTCLFRTMTGLPCPLCGGTRAFTYVASGNSKFLSYNAFWVFVAVAMIIAGFFVIFTRFSLQGFWRRGRLPIYIVTTLLLSGWIWALVNRGTIVG